MRELKTKDMADMLKKGKVKTEDFMAEMDETVEGIEIDPILRHAQAIEELAKVTRVAVENKDNSKILKAVDELVRISTEQQKVISELLKKETSIIVKEREVDYDIEVVRGSDNLISELKIKGSH